ncbi:hypothetical protein EVAR_61703_1 [Eumeta japonica]|uniref:Uncharacterized protein n=1 Tax=Eumeta variegata TaxID=151549 RepID=A0A4C1ZQ51_EUMVA|nr:hypothetical protein EVAR_61703_1 [Eumeta japonica]
MAAPPRGLELEIAELQVSSERAATWMKLVLVRYHDLMTHMTGHRTIVIVSVYLPSPKPLPERPRALLALGDAVILFDDFNCKNPRMGCANG